MFFRSPQDSTEAGVVRSRVLMGKLATHHPEPPFRLDGAHPGVRPFAPPVGSGLPLFHGCLGLSRTPGYGVTVMVPTISGWMVQW